MQSSSFSEKSLAAYQKLASLRYTERVQGTEIHENLPEVAKRKSRSPKPGTVQGTEVVPAYEELDKDPEFSQPRCESGMWRYPEKTGICQPKEAVLSLKQDSERDRLNAALRARLQSLKKAQSHKAASKDSDERPVVIQKIVERRSPTVKLDNTAAIGVLTPEGKFEILQYAEEYDFTAALRG